MRKKWTDEEVQFLKISYPSKDFTIKDISIALSRSAHSINIKAMRLGIKRYKEVLNDNLRRCSRCKTIYKKEFFNKGSYRCKNCTRKIWNERYRLNSKVESVSVESVSVEEKKCFRCGEIKTIDKFNKLKRSPDGYNNTCRQCRNEILNESKIKNLKERGW